MRRTRTYPVTPGATGVADDSMDDIAAYRFVDDVTEQMDGSRYHTNADVAIARSDSEEQYIGRHDTEASSSFAAAALVHNIASFLTLSDAASLVSFAAPGGGSAPSPADSWAVGVELDGDYSSWSPSNMETPQTPALVAVSPGATPRENNYMGNDEDEHDEAMIVSSMGTRFLCGTTSSMDKDSDSLEDTVRAEALFHERRRQWAQEKVITAVFAHPKSLRSYCWEAYTAARDIRTIKQQAAICTHEEETPETHIEPTGLVMVRKRKKDAKAKDLRSKLVHEIVDWIFHRVPVSVLLDVLEAAGYTVVDTTGSSCAIALSSIHHAIAALGSLVCSVWDTATHCVTNPFQVLEAIISLQFNAMGKTSEVLVSGIQSVATGVGSASGIALHRLSATANMSSSTSLAGRGNINSTGGTPGDGKSNALNQRLLHRLSAINDAALVVDYREREEDTCGLTRHAVSRTRRMMHYSVSLRPFVATLTLPYSSPKDLSKFGRDGGDNSPNDSSRDACESTSKVSSPSYESPEEKNYSPFMCTPQSYPPTPNSRRLVLLQRSALSDDVVFLARDRLRVHQGLDSEDERTRERSQALEVGKRLAIFSCDKDSGIELTCGRHIATKCGNTYYASARSMVAVLRNCFVYYEISILPQPVSPSLATLSIGLSTEEMPPNTLVGAWQSSVGLCTTGQILMAGQWCSPADPSKFAYGVGSTVGCLVCLDSESAFETWDGVMVKATLRLTVNGVVVSPPVSTLPMNGAPHLSVGSPTSLSGVLPGIDRTSPSAAYGTSQRHSENPTPPVPTLSLLVPSVEELFPTVTLQSPATSVVCRFSSADVIASTREMIGAPAGVAVYAIDGSVILDVNDESSAS